MNNLEQSQSIEIPVWDCVYGGPRCTGVIKKQASDFIVEEQLSFQPEGSGEHVFIQIQKTGENTEYVARLLARFSGVRQRDVSFAGLKDRHAITTQWFSVWLPGKEDPDWSLLETERVVTAHDYPPHTAVIPADLQYLLHVLHFGKNSTLPQR